MERHVVRGRMEHVGPWLLLLAIAAVAGATVLERRRAIARAVARAAEPPEDPVHKLVIAIMLSAARKGVDVIRFGVHDGRYVVMFQRGDHRWEELTPPRKLRAAIRERLAPYAGDSFDTGRGGRIRTLVRFGNDGEDATIELERLVN